MPTRVHPPTHAGARAAGAVAMACALLAGSGPARADGAWYALDPVHTRVAFSIRHAGFSDAIGTVSGSTGRVYFDPDDWRRARVEVTVPMTRVDLGDSAWNEATLAAGLLDAGSHPVAVFTSERIEPLAPDRARVHGQLTLRGVTRPLVLDAVLNASRRHPLPPFRRTIGLSASASLSRAEYGITAWKSVIGDAVAMRIEVEATRSRDAAPEQPGDVPDATAPRDPALDGAPVPAVPRAPEAAPASAPEPGSAPAPAETGP